MFGHTWVSQYGAQPDGIAADTWAVALGGLSGSQIATGLRETLLTGGEWPPSAPRFRRMCFGIPRLSAVRLDLRQTNTVRSPFSNKVWSFVDGYRYIRATVDDADRMLRDAYELAVDDVMRGGELPERVPELAAPEPEAFHPASPETAREHLGKIAELLRTPPAPAYTEVDDDSVA